MACSAQQLAAAPELLVQKLRGGAAGLPGSSKALMQSTDVLKFQLPASFYVYVSAGCGC